MYFFGLRCSQDANLEAKLSDFGFAMQLPQQVGSTQLITAVVGGTLAGTRGYLAPEYIEGKHGVKSDIYSYGVAYNEDREEYPKLVTHLNMSTSLERKQ